MAYTKGQIVDEALGELGLGSAFDIDPEERRACLRRLDAMMALWEAKGVRVGYNGPGALADDSGLPLSAVETVFLSLAIRCAPGYGKQIKPETMAAARAGYDALLIAAAMPPQQQLPSMPRGAGNRAGLFSIGGTFSAVPTQEPMEITAGGDLSINTD